MSLKLKAYFFFQSTQTCTVFFPNLPDIYLGKSFKVLLTPLVSLSTLENIFLNILYHTDKLNTDVKLKHFFIAIKCVFKNISRPRL